MLTKTCETETKKGEKKDKLSCQRKDMNGLATGVTRGQSKATYQKSHPLLIPIFYFLKNKNCYFSKNKNPQIIRSQVQ